MSGKIPIAVEFRCAHEPPTSLAILTHKCSGGLELLFANQRTHKLEVPAVDSSTNAPTTVGYLVRYLVGNVMADKRKELFVVDGTV
jgi:ubiquitin related modifier 1